MYAAMLSLYEVSLALVRLVIVAREGKQGLKAKSRIGIFSSDDEDE